MGSPVTPSTPVLHTVSGAESSYLKQATMTRRCCGLVTADALAMSQNLAAVSRST
jgi:hypothetical protein